MVGSPSLSPPSELSPHFQILILYYDIISHILFHLPLSSEISPHFQILVFIFSYPIHSISLGNHKINGIIPKFIYLIENYQLNYFSDTLFIIFLTSPLLCGGFLWLWYDFEERKPILMAYYRVQLEGA